MTSNLIHATDTQKWRDALKVFPRVDVCQLPEYHVAYAARIASSQPMMWRHEDNEENFCYPFLLTPVILEEKETGYRDISSIYGYSGPLSTTQDQDFLAKAWGAFDDWAQDQKVIAEFIRFSLYADTKSFAHKDTQIELNRPSAVSHLPDTEEELLSALGKKTRNMLRKAENSGLEARELDPKEQLSAFRTLYEETMGRNEAPDFFLYDDHYYECLLSLPPDELKLFGVFHEKQMVAASMALTHGQGALYHLGASLNEFSKQGAGNLAMFEMSKTLIDQEIKFLTVGGGRTTAQDDPLFRFKKSNAISVEDYYIGKRIVDPKTYDTVVKDWENLYKTEVNSSKLIFYR